MSGVAPHADEGPLIIGRYAIFDALASGGMATVHLGRFLGAGPPAGGARVVGRTVAVKRLHAELTNDPELVTMFMDEARIVTRIVHPNVVPVVDILESREGLFLVMEYVHGETLSRLLRAAWREDAPVPLKVVAAILHGALLGLHGAHETRGAQGEELSIVHRDVSPQNIIVGNDGVARVLDFGVAKAAGRLQVTREGQLKGKLAYMSPEQLRGEVDRRADVFAAAVVLWEAAVGRRLHEGAREPEILSRIVTGNFPRPSTFRPELPPELDAIVMRGLEADPARRYATARDMAFDLERTIGLAPSSEVGPWVERLAASALQQRAEMVAAMERATDAVVTGPSPERHAPPSRTRDAPPSPEGQDLSTFIAILAFLCALGLVGAVLTGVSLYKRSSRTAPAEERPGAPKR